MQFSFFCKQEIIKNRAYLIHINQLIICFVFKLKIKKKIVYKKGYYTNEVKISFVSLSFIRNKSIILNLQGKEGIEWTKKECEVITDLILNYKSVFQVEDEEAKREKRILEVLEKVHESPNTLPIPKPSGDFKISIYIGSRRGEAITIPVSTGLLNFIYFDVFVA